MVFWGQRALKFVFLVNIAALAACSSGGGGGMVSAGNTNTGNGNTGGSNTGTDNSGSTGGSNTGGSNTGTGNSGGTGSGNTDTAGNTPTPAVSIVAPSLTVSGMVATTHATFSDPLASPVFSMHGNAVAVTQTSVSDAGLVVNGRLQNLGGAERVSLSIPALGLDNVVLQADGTARTLADGSVANAALAHTDYMAMGAWSYAPASGAQAYLGQIVFGYATDSGAIPTTGAATYSGTAGATTGVHGAYAVPSGTGTIQGGTLSGDVSMTVDFANNTASGAFTNMVATPLEGGGAALPWNDLSLSGKVQRATGTSGVSGVTSAGVPRNASAASFSAGASGSFTSSFFGPAGEELGGSWSVSDAPSSGGKAAYGTFGARK